MPRSPWHHPEQVLPTDGQQVLVRFNPQGRPPVGATYQAAGHNFLVAGIATLYGAREVETWRPLPDWLTPPRPLPAQTPLPTQWTFPECYYPPQGTYVLVRVCTPYRPPVLALYNPTSKQWLLTDSGVYLFTWDVWQWRAQ